MRQEDQRVLNNLVVKWAAGREAREEAINRGEQVEGGSEIYLTCESDLLHTLCNIISADSKRRGH